MINRRELLAALASLFGALVAWRPGKAATYSPEVRKAIGKRAADVFDASRGDGTLVFDGRIYPMYDFQLLRRQQWTRLTADGRMEPFTVVTNVYTGDTYRPGLLDNCFVSSPATYELSIGMLCGQEADIELLVKAIMQPLTSLTPDKFELPDNVVLHRPLCVGFAAWPTGGSILHPTFICARADIPECPPPRGVTGKLKTADGYLHFSHGLLVKNE